MNLQLTGLFYLLIIFSGCKNNDAKNTYAGWEVYGGTKEGIRYSSLTEIDTSNVQQLAIAWTYHTGDADTAHQSQIQCNPIIVDGILYGSTPMQKIFAADAVTGKQQWVFNPLDSAAGNASFFIMNNIRGVSYWSDGKDKRIFYYKKEAR